MYSIITRMLCPFQARACPRSHLGSHPARDRRGDWACAPLPLHPLAHIHPWTVHQVAALLSKTGREGEDERPVLYVSGEESTEQIGSRAERMGMGPEGESIFLYRLAWLPSAGRLLMHQGCRSGGHWQLRRLSGPYKHTCHACQGGNG